MSDEKVKRKIEGQNLSLLISLSNPRAKLEILQIISDHVIWMTIFDDMLENSDAVIAELLKQKVITIFKQNVNLFYNYSS